MDLSARYTQVLEGRTIAAVVHDMYGCIYMSFTDGSTIRVHASGTPPTLFLRSMEDGKLVDQLDDPLSGFVRGGNVLVAEVREDWGV